MRHRSVRLTKLFVIAGLFGLLSACANDAPLDTLDPAGPEAQKILDLFNGVLVVAAVVFVLVQGLLVYAVIRFRDRGGKEPKQTHGNTKAEIAWTIVPAVILALVSIPTVALIFDLAREPKNPVRIEVIGHQWWWEYRYEGTDVVTANEMHIPIDRPVYLSMTAAEESAVAPLTAPGGVIHSFWVPRLAGKQDVVPGHTSNIILEADEVGTYLGQCAEFCGTSHANMRLRVITHTPADYEKWIVEQSQPAKMSADSEGARVFAESGCAGCHSIRGVSDTGLGAPNLTHLASRSTFAGGIFETDSESLEAWLRDPPGQKPGALMPNLNLSNEAIETLVDFLTSLE